MRLAIDEDLGALGDWTTRALVAEDVVGRAAVVARQPGVVAGLPAVDLILAHDRFASPLAAAEPRTAIASKRASAWARSKGRPADCSAPSESC